MIHCSAALPTLPCDRVGAVEEALDYVTKLYNAAQTSLPRYHLQAADTSASCATKWISPHNARC